MRDNQTPRMVAIAVAVMLGLLAALYLGGLLGQMSDGYNEWLSQDGLTGNAMLKAPDFSPAACIPNAFGASGIKSTLTVMGAGAVLLLCVKLRGASGGEYDERNFKRAKEGTYGTAAWMSDKEMKSVLEVTSPAVAMGTILGEKKGKVVCLPRDTRLNKHMFVCGSTGTGKSRAIVRNLLFQSIKRGESVVLTDSKAELYDDTSELFRRNGYKVKVFNLINPEHSDSWNCMADLMGDTLTTQILTDGIISNTAKGGQTDHFWDNGEGNLLKSLILYIDQDEGREPNEKHLPAVYQFLTQNSEKELGSLFARLPMTHPAKAPYSLFAQASDTVRAGIVLGLGTRLQILQNEAIRRVTSSSEIDLAEPGRTKCAYYIILSDQEGTTEFLSSLFFSFLFIQLTRYADATPEKRCKVPVNIIFEEFNNVGRLDSYPRRLSVARSRALQICHIVQSLAQFQNRYPDNEWAEIIGSCDSQVMLGVTEQESAEFFSMRSGDSTVRVNSTMTVKQTMALAQMIPQYRETDGLGRRRLLTPDEILRFPNEELLIVIRGQNVLRANKFDFEKHPMGKKLPKTSIFNYCPSSRKAADPQIEIIRVTDAPAPQTGTKPGRKPAAGAKPSQSGAKTSPVRQGSPENPAPSQTEMKSSRKPAAGTKPPRTETKTQPAPAGGQMSLFTPQTESKPEASRLFADMKPPPDF